MHRDVARILALANQKGGVGKTTTAVNLAAALAVAERPTLLVDLDPQANASSASGIPTGFDGPNVYDVLMGRCSAEEALVPGGLPMLNILPSSRNLIGAEIELIDMEGRETVLKRALEPLRSRFEYAIVDCPPSLGLLTLNALVAADALVAPVQAEYLAMEGLGALMGTIERIRGAMNPRLEIEGILITMHEGRLNLTRQVEQEIRDHFGTKVFKTVISRNVRLSEAPSFGKPIVLYDARCRGCLQYMDLAAEILERRGTRRGR